MIAERLEIDYLCIKFRAMSDSLNNAQLELLKLFSSDLSEEEMQDLRGMLIEFRVRRLQQAIENLNPSQEQIEAWGKGHDRTPYHSQNTKNQSSV